ncbi:hypothetical protein [Streptomyces qinzhouensis]|uniref:Lysine transporter LysE n=1 Tax=Streptomyces qinzhouensis TaxID=2599401 RepID=A0A5B8J865_9ACTN|nr:hypothetical protein [Streptomyces qinzhouensis]QDY76624.1 hypothetical protein FQU76_08830 [Streptomyces qinzhouensis]
MNESMEAGMEQYLTAGAAGAVAGLGVAVPLGAVGVLVLQQAMRDRRAGAAAGAAVAVVDAGYAALATAVGPLVAAALAGVEAWVRLVAALVLAVIAALGLLASRRPAPAGTTGTAGTETAAPARVFVRFAALTFVNPTTALYFAALTTAQGDTLRGGAAGAVFTFGVFAASLLWQQTLVVAGGFAGPRLPDRARVWTFRAGYGLVAGYAVTVALPLPAL